METSPELSPLQNLVETSISSLEILQILNRGFSQNPVWKMLGIFPPQPLQFSCSIGGVTFTAWKIYFQIVAVMCPELKVFFPLVG